MPRKARDFFVNVRLSEQEHRQLVSLAEADSRTVSDFIRVLLAERAERDARVPDPAVAALVRRIAQRPFESDVLVRLAEAIEGDAQIGRLLASVLNYKACRDGEKKP